MAEGTPTRRTGRQRVPNRKYANDAFEVLNTVLSSDSEDEALLQQQQQLDDDSDEFNEGQLQADEQDTEDSIADVSDGSEVLTPVEEYEDAHSYAGSDPGSDIHASYRGENPEDTANKEAWQDKNIHSRGMIDKPLVRDGPYGIVKTLAGSGKEDICNMLRARDHWSPEPTLPRRSKFRWPFSHTDEKRKMEATVGWDWYYDQGGREYFASKQISHLLDVEEVAKYEISSTLNAEFMMGPYGMQRRFSLSPMQTLDIDQTWATMGRPQLGHLDKDRKRHGFILNTGACVRCLEWAPNHEGNRQYFALAISKPPTSELQDKPPAFTSSPGPSRIQIWTLTSASVQVDSLHLTLRANLCSEWGDVLKMKWCPVPREQRNSGSLSPTTKSSTYIGLLAGIWADGCARVLDVQLDDSPGNPMSALALRYECAAFTASPPPDNVSTCLTWLSASDLAIGYSNGEVAIYDIYPTHSPGRCVEGDPKSANNSPWLYLPLHGTYILSLTSGYPSHPSLLISSAMDGYLRLTSLLTPTVDFVFSQRTRTPPCSLAYCESLLSIAAMEDNSETVRIWALRCFYASSACATLLGSPGPGPNVIDVGKCHPTIAAGAASGSVVVTNPIRKMMSKKRIGDQQVIFQHEWRPTSTEKDPTGRRIGLSRFTEGYKPVHCIIGNAKTPNSSRANVAMTTIHEEETAVTALSWNPNISHGGWLGVGWASGLVRIQDVAI